MGSKIRIMLAAAATAGVAFGATGFAGALPNGAQNVAHTVLGAPAATKPTPHPKPTPHAKGKSHTGRPAANPHKQTPVGPDAKGPAAHGLCTAYAHSHKHGKAMGHSIAMRNLARAAGGAANIPAYCAKR